MDAFRFDRWTRALGLIGSRRQTTLGLLLGAIVAAGRGGKVAAGPGCKNVGKKCKRAKTCCSGVCKGKKGKKKCRSHDAGGCKAGAEEAFCGGVDDECTTSSGASGNCNTTTGQAGYCSANGVCFNCTRDADCRAICGPKAACVACAACTTTGNRGCAGVSAGSCNLPM